MEFAVLGSALPGLPAQAFIPSFQAHFEMLIKDLAIFSRGWGIMGSLHNKTSLNRGRGETWKYFASFSGKQANPVLYRGIKGLRFKPMEKGALASSLSPS